MVEACQRMHDFINDNRAVKTTNVKTRRVSKKTEMMQLTSSEMMEAAYCRSRDSNRKEVREIMQSYQLEQPLMRMKWKEPHQR
jgi:hypothetical protein